jgi:hypothetical protein
MSGVARRYSRLLCFAMLVLFRGVPLFAHSADQLAFQSHGGGGGAAGLFTIGVICLVLYLVYRLLRGIVRALRRGGKPQVIVRPAPPALPPRPPASLSEPPALPKAAAKSKSIFISYRRQDSAYIAGHIYEKLSTQFGKDAVFKDVDSIPLGVDFPEHIREQLGHCLVVVVVIGRHWNGDEGERRLNDPRDHFRIEIETALERRIPVIPVLVDGMEMPRVDEMPLSLAKLAKKNGIKVRPDPDFHNDADKLAHGIESLLE